MKNILKSIFSIIALITTITLNAQMQNPSENAEHFRLADSKVDFKLGKEKLNAKFSVNDFNYFDLNDKKKVKRGYFVIDVAWNKKLKSKDNKVYFTVNNMKLEKDTNGAYYADITVRLNGINKTFNHELITFNKKDKTATFIIVFKRGDFNLAEEGTISALIKI